jgi:hypothetical protein
MIVKKIRNQNTPKPKTKQIADLVDYIRQPHNTNPAEKIEHSGGLNFLTGMHGSQKKEMITLATETVHSKMPVSHFVFSWRENEQPAAAQVDELVDIFLREMGLEGCQTVYGLHYNTENYHVHIAVNRMHPVTMKVIDPNNGFDIEAAHKILALVEHRQGWTPEANARYVVNEHGEIVRRKGKTGPKPKAPALDYEAATGAKSAQRIAQERGHAPIKNAQSWPELHEKLAAAGLRFEQKGSGAIIFVGEVAVKASSVDRAFSMGKLCKSLGEFVAGNYAAVVPRMEPEPVSSVNLEDWKAYQAAFAPAPYGPRIDMEGTCLSMLKVRQQKNRENLPGKLAGHPRCILNIARRFLRLQHKEERKQLRRAMSSRRKPKLGRFEDWLRAHGQERKAEQWRYRHTLEALPAHMREAPPLPSEQKYDPVKAYAAHRQTLLRDMPDAEPSRVDAYIALRMREKGFKRETVLEAILQCAPQAQEGQDARDWRRYAERVTVYAFGVAGDMKLAQVAAYREEKWKEAAEKKQEQQAQRETVPDAPRVRMR